MQLTEKQFHVLKATAAAGVLVATFIFSLSATVLKDKQLGFNWTNSLPGWFYLIDYEKSPKLERGEIIAFIMPKNRYYTVEKPIAVKIIGGLPGDVVTEKNREYYINGEPLGIRAKEFSMQGYPLDKGPVGTIPEGHVFVYTPAKDGYDSRYKDIGWVPYERIIGPAEFIM